MLRSSVGSAPGDTLLDTYPVDDIIQNTNCELHFKMKNISMKVADAVLGNVVISKKILRTRKIMVMHSNERR